MDAAMRWRLLSLVSAVIGAGISAYLLVEYSTGQPGICLTGSGCDDVRASAFAYPLGMPMPLFGLGFFLAAGWLAVRSTDPRPWLGTDIRAALLLLAGAGVAVFAVLTALEAFVIESFCTWCLAAAGAGLLLLAGALGVWRSPRPTPDEARSSRARQLSARATQAQDAIVRRTLGISGLLTVAALAGLLALGAAGGAPVSPGAPDRLAPAGSPRLGSGAVTIVEFADFQCPACAVVGAMLQQLAENDEATLVYRHFPLEAIHANAAAAARAASAAQRQDGFWSMAEALYARQAAWESLGSVDADAFFAALAGELGLDVGQWSSDYASDNVQRQVADDAGLARDLNLPGTPSIFIGGRLYTGDRTPEAVRAAIAAAAGGG